MVDPPTPWPPEKADDVSLGTINMHRSDHNEFRVGVSGPPVVHCHDPEARSMFRWKWKKKRTRRLQKKRRKMRQRSK